MSTEFLLGANKSIDRKDCLKSVLNEMLTGFGKDSRKTDRCTISVMKQAKALFDEITRRKLV